MERQFRFLTHVYLKILLMIIFVCAGSAAAQGEGNTVETGGSMLKANVGGYIEGWYRLDNSDLSSQTTAAKKVDHEFRIRRARIDVKGEVTDQIGYRVTGNFDGPSPASGTTGVKLWDGYITYKVHPLAIFTFGQLKYPFTLEGLEGAPDRVPVLKAEFINDVAGKLGTQGGSFRDIGIKIDGKIKDLQGLNYSLALINGAGINRGDNNGKKDIVGRVAVSPVKGLTLGISGYTGRGEGEIDQAAVKENAYGFDAEYLLNAGVHLRGEYVTAKWENWDVDRLAASSGKTQKPVGWYLQASYKLQPLPDLELLARYEDYEKDSNTDDSHLMTTTLGITYYLKGKNRITANYLMRDAGKSSTVTAQETDAAGSTIGNLFLVQAITVF